MIPKKKYRDLPRFPKVQTNGYEKEYKKDYSDMIKTSLTEIGVLISKRIKEKKV